MPIVRVKENEPFDVALRRFKRAVEKTGLLTELRAREFYEKPTAERKRKQAAAVKRHCKHARMLPPKQAVLANDPVSDSGPPTQTSSLPPTAMSLKDASPKT